MRAIRITYKLLFAVAVMLWSGAAVAQQHAPLYYQGGPVLERFRIFPLYYGNWNAADITTQQEYLVALGAYLSGSNGPAGQQPMLKQYGVVSATVAPAATSSASATPVKLKPSEALNIIHSAQASNLLPAYSSTTLLMLFLAHGFSLEMDGGCAFHSSESASSIYAVVPKDCGPTFSLVSAHEVFEAAANPHGDAWGEAVDGCGSIHMLSFGAIPGAADNTQGGTCSQTGYTKIPAAPSVASCAVAEASAFETRVHVRCGTAINGISYFAVVTASPDNAARFVELFDAARARARTLHIFYDPADLTGAYFGCHNADCRVARGVEIF